ncbi:phosphatidylserine decarboxylase [Serratia symbiotica str. 'Cinara cedri']|nr:phosphatidylserine decarboxylase [Serratia symbiotica str. 'Cinara cedri']
MLNNIKIKLQHWLPKLALTGLAGWIAEKQAGWLTQLIVKTFAYYYHIDMQTAQNPDLSSYATFNDFFMRPLRTDARPIINDTNWLALPADGTISQLGLINDDLIFQAKGLQYSLGAILASHPILTKIFHKGLFATTYLAPSDYHRVHMPCTGVLNEMIYVPGELFSVNPITTTNVPNLFARNERIICVFDTTIGPMAQILIGATIVGSIETVWSGPITPPHTGIIKRWAYPTAGQDGIIKLEKGAEMGRFKLGSTVINLFIEGSVQFAPQLKHGSVTRMGEAFAKILTTEITTKSP